MEQLKQKINKYKKKINLKSILKHLKLFIVY